MQEKQKFHHKRKENVNIVQEYVCTGFVGYRSAFRVALIQVHSKELRTKKHNASG
jgi:hypothetical protein